MSRSGQKLGFDPRNHDGVFTGLDDDVTTVSGVRPDADLTSRPRPKSPFNKWRIYPHPPPPHWHWRGHDTDTAIPRSSGPEPAEDEEFDFDMCDIPAAHEWSFAIDEKGVFQVFNSGGESS